MWKRLGPAEILVIAVVVATVVVAGLSVAGCGRKSAVSKTSQGTAPGTAPSANSTVAVFLSKGDTVFRVSRAVSKAGVAEALTEMLKGPTDAEKNQGLATAIPEGTRLLSYNVEGGEATADFSSELKNYGGGSARVQGIIDQITNTVTSNDPSVTAVEITVAGIPAEESLQP